MLIFYLHLVQKNYNKSMNKSKRTKFEDYWMLRIPSFPEDKRSAVHELAAKERMTIGAYIGNVLEKEIEKSRVRPRIGG